MKKIKIHQTLCMLILSFMLPVGVAHADLFYGLNTVIGGDSVPESTTTPWVTAQFSQVDANTVSLTLAAPNLTTHPIAEPNGEYAFSWSFNYANAATDAFNLSVSYASGLDSVFSIVGDNGGVVFGHLFDISLFYLGFHFTNAWTSVLTLQNLAHGLSVNDFASLSEGTGPGYYAAATIQNIPGGEGGDFSVIAAPAVGVPEPVTYLSLATLLVLVAGISRRKALARI